MNTPFRMLNSALLARKIATGKPGESPYALFLGAGASTSSGIPSAAAMIHMWKRMLCRYEDFPDREPSAAEEAEWMASKYDKWTKNAPEQTESEYGRLFGHFYHHAAERQRYIEEIIDGKNPTFGYLYLAGLIQAERLNVVLTTNFDDLVADALIRYYGIRPIVCAFDSEVRSIRLTSRRPKILKLHGDFLYDSMRNLAKESRHLAPNMEEKLQEVCTDSGLIVVGYDGNDESVMAPLNHLLRDNQRLRLGVHWCVWAPAGAEPRISPKLKELLLNYSDRIHLYRIDSFDTLMMQFFEECKCEFPRVFMEPHSSSAFQEFRKAVEGATAYLPHSRMQDHLDLFFQRSTQPIDQNEAIVKEADSSHRKGNQEVLVMYGALDLKKHEEAAARAESAAAHYVRSLKLVEQVLADSAAGIEIRAKALKRKTGCLAGLIETDYVCNPSNWRNRLREGLRAVEDGRLLCQSSAGAALPLPLRRTFYYNGCCMFGSQVTGRQMLSRDDAQRLMLDYQQLSELDPEREERNCLNAEERSFAPLRPILALPAPEITVDAILRIAEDALGGSP